MISEQLNVIIINDFANVTGGGTKVAIDTAVGLSYAGVNVHYFCAVGQVDKRLTEAPIKSIIYLDQPEILHAKNKILALLRGVWNNKANAEIKKLLKGFDNRNTVIHVHGWVKSLSISPLIGALNKKFPVVITLHDFFIYCPNGGFYNFPGQHICTKTPLSASCILSNCDSRNYGFKLYRVLKTAVQKAVLSSRKKQISLIALSKLSFDVLNPYIKNFKKTYFIENPIDTFKYPRPDIKNNNTCVFVGRLTSEKGVVVFCEALRRLNISDAIIIGEGPEKETLESQYPELQFVGWKSRDQISEIFKRARFLVFPSVWYETYGLVVQEASSYGVPCIISDCTAACEMVEHGKDGLIFKSKDVSDLANCMKQLYNSEQYLSNMSEAAYNKFWSEDRSIKNYAGAVKKVYEEMLIA